MEIIQFRRIGQKMKITILLVEDSPNWYDIINFILWDEGYEVIWAKSTDHAEKMLTEKKDNISVAIVNLNLHPVFPIPDGMGYTFLNFIKDHHPELPRFVLSAIDHQAKIDELFWRYGVNGVWQKKDSFSREMVIQTLNNLHLSTQNPG